MDQGTNPVNPYAPTGAPYAPGSNTPAPVFTPISPAPEKPKLFTKKFIIFIIIGIVLIVAAIVAAVIIRSSRQGNNTNTPPSSQQEATVRELANLLISGNKSTDIPNLETPTWYATELLVSARDENTSVANNYISEIRSLAGALPTSDISTHLDAYASCLAMGRYENSEVASSCLSSADSLKTAIKEIYNNVSEAKS